MANHSTDDISNSALELFIEQKRYHALKALLLNEEEQRLGQLESYFENSTLHAEKIAQALPLALKKSESTALDNALSDSVQNCVIAAIQENPVLYADVLYPVVFPAIKKSISIAFKELMQSLNTALEQSLSFERIAWHYESWRSGLPYREIVLSHTLAYRVEQVFLIHRETGLLLHHTAMEGLALQKDGDSVSAMLTAIQDFIKDSFSVDTHDHLDMVEIGEYTVSLNRGSYAVLACVVQGILPYSLRETFQQILTEIHRQHGHLLKNFTGDTSTLVIIEPDLQRCLLSERKQKPENVSSNNYVLVAFLMVLATLGYWYYDQWQFDQRASGYVRLLKQQPGVVITQNYYDNGQLHITGLYDPIGENPDILIEHSQLTNNEVSAHWQPYQSLAPSLVERRFKQLLQPPLSVQINLNKDQLKVSGLADEQWITKLSMIAPVFTGTIKINSNDLISYPQRIANVLQPPTTVKLSYSNGELQLQGNASISWFRSLTDKIKSLDFVTNTNVESFITTEAIRLQELIRKINGQPIYFSLNSTQLTEKESKKLFDLIANIKEAHSLSLELKLINRLVITGYADGIGTLKKNRELAENRAKIVIERLKHQQVVIDTELRLQLAQSGIEDASERKVSFALSATEGNKR